MASDSKLIGNETHPRSLAREKDGEANTVSSKKKDYDSPSSKLFVFVLILAKTFP